VSGTVAQACAGALLGAGLVGAGAATFGIGPAVGIAVTYGLLKGIAEAKYQARNNSLKKGVVQLDDNDGDGPYLAISDPSMLCPLIAKVLKKYERVQRAAAQAGAFGKTAHVTSTLRHARTAIRGALNGVNAAVVGILGAALYEPIWTSTILGAADAALVLLAFAALTVAKLPVFVVVAMAAATGIALTVI